MTTGKTKGHANRFTRSRSGCLTCKKRHLKCDERPGICLQCDKAKLKCEGYAPPKTWMFEVKADSEGQTRRPTRKLSSEKLRREPTDCSSQLAPACGSTLDPFQVSPLSLDLDTANYLLYYKRILEPAVSGQWRPGELVPTVTLQDCFRDELRMRGLRLLAVSHMEHTAHFHGALGKTCFHVDECIQVVKHCIQQREAFSSTLVFVVIHLSAAEGARGNLKASMAHLRGAREIINQLGGPDKLDETTREILSGLGVYRAVQMMQKPLWPCFFDPGSASEALRHHRDLLKNLKESSRIGIALIVPENALQDLVKRLAEALRVWEYAWSRNSADSRIWRWLLLRFRAIQHCMLQNEQNDPELEALRTALIVWNTMVRSRWGAQRIVKTAVPVLRKALTNCPSCDLWHASTICQWALTIGAMAAESTTEEQWFKEQLQSLCAGHSLHDHYQKLRVLSMECFYFEPLQADSLWTLSISTFVENSKAVDSDGGLMARPPLVAV